MKTSNRFLFFPLLAIFAALIFYACQKELSLDMAVPAGKYKLSVFLTDGPLDFQKVLVDIQRVEVKLDTCKRNNDDDDDHHGPGHDDDHDSLNRHCEIWDTLDIRPGIYDLLQLRNGTDTLLASGFLLQGKIKRIKLTLGTRDSVMVDSMMKVLRLVNNQNFVYIDIKKEHLDSLSSNNFHLYLDFDLARSIKYINGEYWLKPKIKPFGKHSTGEIEGKVRPVHSFGTIMAYNATDTAYARPWDQGEFKIRGLREGTYSLFIQGINGYQDTTLTNLIVRRGKETKVGLIQLQK
jgi:hypothetical protein